MLLFIKGLLCARCLLNTVSIVSHEIFTTIIWGGYYSPRFLVEEAETQRTEVSCEVNQLMMVAWAWTPHHSGSHSISISKTSFASFQQPCPSGFSLQCFPGWLHSVLCFQPLRSFCDMGERACYLESDRPGFKTQLTIYSYEILGKWFSLFRPQFLTYKISNSFAYFFQGSGSKMNK